MIVRSTPVSSQPVRHVAPLIAATVAALLAVLLSGCGALDDTQETVNTVDDSVALLQDLDRRAAWDMLADGFDALIDNGVGFVAEAKIASPGDDTAALSLTITVDADSHAEIVVQRADDATAPAHYRVDLDPGNEPDAAYRQIAPETFCLPDDTVTEWLGAGLPRLFDRYGLQELLQQTLAVTEWDEDAEPEQAGREGDLYAVESRVDDALDLLSAFDNDDLRERVAASPAGALRTSGSLILDESTGALLHLELVMTASDAGAAQPVARFTITQWDDVAAISLPDPAAISDRCP